MTRSRPLLYAFHILISIALLAIIPINAHGKTISFFSNLSMRDGLPSNIIASIAQDQHDFIWVATGSGLARYDGYKFRVFKKTELSNSLPSNELSTLLADGEHIWVGTWNGLCKINIKTFEITRINLGEPAAIRALFKGKDNALWVGTGNGLIRYDPTSQQYQVYNNQQNGLSHNTVRTIHEDHHGTLWVGTYDQLNILPKGKDQFITIPLPQKNIPGIKNHLILDIQVQKAHPDSMLWVGTETGLFQVNIASRKAERYNGQGRFSNDVIKCIFTDQNNHLWLGTDFGLNIFDPEYETNTVHFHNPQLPYSIANNVIWQIFEDRSGVLWLVTSNGLSRINQYGSFYEYQEISHTVEDQLIGNQVKTILIDSKGIYWLGTQDGVIRINPESGTKKVFDINSKHRLLLNNVFALEEDLYGHIWIGSAGGINIWDEANEQMHAITANQHNGLSSNYIGKFTKGADGAFWVSAWEGGLYKVDGNLQTLEELLFRPIPDLEAGSAKNVFGNGALWVIEYDELFRADTASLTKEHISTFSEASGKQTIYSVYFSKKGHLWAGTLNGLVQYIPEENRSVFHQVVTGSDEIVSSIIEDEAGNIWSTTNTSLQKLSPPTGEIEHYPLDKDLPLKSFYYGCAARAQNGEIIFGGDNGYIRFAPGKAHPNLFDPKVYITAIEINNRSVGINDQIDGEVLLQRDVAFTQALTLEYEQRSVTFEFSSLHFWQPAMNVFAYKLEGLDEEWNYVSGLKNFAVYSNLPAGKYTFKVKGSNNYGVESTHMASLGLTVKPPLLLSTGFFVLYVILGSLAIFYSLRFYSSRVHLRNELRIIRMEKEHAEEIEQTKEQFFTNISHELRTPISLILPPIHEIQKKGHLDTQSTKLIALAEKNSVRLLRLVNQILDFNKLENETLQIKVAPVDLVKFCQEVFVLFTDQAERQQIHFSFESSHDEHRVWVDAEKIETVLFNLLSNAFKFTHAGGSITLQLRILEDSPPFKEGAFEFRVSDTGVGISEADKTRVFERFYQTKAGRKMDASTGIGLTLAAEYVDLHHGTITVESALGVGTTFTVQLPLGKTHFPIDSVQDEEINLRATRSLYAHQEGAKPYHLDLDSDKPMVLIIEDNTDIIDFIRTSLGHKFNFVVAQNGEEGLQKANNFMPEVIISDIMMPVMDGLTLCEKVKENPKTSHITIILLTAKSMPSNRLEGIKKGADVYLTKPFEIELLEAHVNNLIHRKKELTSYFRNELVVSQDTPETKDNQDNKFLKKVMDLIEANISEPDFGVENISKEIGMSSTHLYRRLKALTNLSAQDIIKKYRIKKASLLLENNEGNVSETMYKVGFSSASYFSKCFKAEFGMTPKEFQRERTSASDKSLDI